MKTTTPIDWAGFAVSSLCIMHCLLLPILGTSLPLLGALSEIEWVHKALVLVAVPIALSFLFSTKRQGLRILAALGIVTLCSAAFVPAFHDLEVVMTAIGGLMLGLAHLSRLIGKHHAH